MASRIGEIGVNVLAICKGSERYVVLYLDADPRRRVPRAKT